jgi:hypothetical protein
MRIGELLSKVTTTAVTARLVRRIGTDRSMIPGFATPSRTKRCDGGFRCAGRLALTVAAFEKLDCHLSEAKNLCIFVNVCANAEIPFDRLKAGFRCAQDSNSTR